MGNGYFKYYKSKFLIVLVIYLVIAIIWAKESLKLSLSITSTVVFVLFLIEKYLWKIKPFSFLLWIDDFSGRYEGEFEYMYKDDKCNVLTGKLKHVKIISQTGSEIYVHSFTIKVDGTKSSVSENKGMYVEKTSDGKHFRLIYNYYNEGNFKLNLSPHYGTEVIKIIKKGNEKFIEGIYYTNRLPNQTRGEFKNMKWVSNDINHEF